MGTLFCEFGSATDGILELTETTNVKQKGICNVGCMPLQLGTTLLCSFASGLFQPISAQCQSTYSLIRGKLVGQDQTYRL